MNKADILSQLLFYLDSQEKKKFIPGKTYIPPSGAKILDDDIVHLMETVLDGWFTEGKNCKEFSNKLSSRFGHEYCVLCNSGSSASLLSISAMKKLKKHSTKKLVITCAVGFPTTVSPIYQNGFVPYYIDIRPETLSPDISKIYEMLDSKKGEEIAGIVLAHNLGFTFDEPYVYESILLSGRSCWFIVDCCDALGSEIIIDEMTDETRHVGWWGDIATCSFFPAHHITTGEGGSILTSRPDAHNMVRKLSNWGRSCYCQPGQQNVCGHRFDWEDRGKLPEGFDHKYIFDELGYNLKMTELQAALGSTQMNKEIVFADARLDNYGFLEARLHELSFKGFISLIDYPDWSMPVPFGFPILVNYDETGEITNKFSMYLEENKIGTRRLFAGNLLWQPAFMNLPYERDGNLDGAERVTKNMIWIGCHQSLTKEMLEYMIDKIYKFFEVI